MRHSILMILAVMAALLFSACAGTVKNTARVDISMDQNRQAYADSIYGQISMDDWLDILVRQAQSTVAIALWEQAKQASKNGKPEEAKKYIDLAQEISVNNTYTKAKLINASDYRLKVLDGPFADEVLDPGASTSEKRVPVGSLSFTVLWGSKQDKRAIIVRQVTAGQKSIVIINK